MNPVDVGDGQFALAAAIAVVAAYPALHRLEVRQPVRIRPAGVAEACPMVEVGRLAAVVDQAVDGRGAAQRAALRNRHAPPVGLRRAFA
ncbi:hypothetical protein G6F40_015794 [Rhizopus arrhizus]|nr:hypothetical protein G6F40_015794 [Rhizopus arrhizus]